MAVQVEEDVAGGLDDVKQRPGPTPVEETGRQLQRVERRRHVRDDPEDKPQRRPRHPDHHRDILARHSKGVHSHCRTHSQFSVSYKRVQERICNMFVKGHRAQAYFHLRRGSVKKQATYQSSPSNRRGTSPDRTLSRCTRSRSRMPKPARTGPGRRAGRANRLAR